MSREIVRRAVVLDDLHKLADYIARDNLDAAIRFLDAAEATFRSLTENPEIGNSCDFQRPDLARIKQWHVHGFRKYLIFYLANETEVEVVRVLHAARDWEVLLDKDT